MSDVVEDANFPRFAIAAREDLRTGFAFPILVGGTVFGVLEFFSHERRLPDDDLIVMMSTIGAQAGLFIQRKHAESDLLAREELYRTLAESIPALVCRARPDGTLDYFNARFFEYTGLTPDRTTAADIRGVFHPDEEGEVVRRWREAISSGEPYSIEYRVRRADGAYRWHLGRVVPVRERRGQIVSWLSSSTDIDDQKRAEESERFLSEASAALASSLDYETTLKLVTELAVPTVADLCSVDMLRPDGSLRRVALVCADPAKQAQLDQMPADFSPAPDGPHPARRVLRTGRGERIAVVQESDLASVARDHAHLTLLRDLGVRSAMMAPLIARDRTYGTLLFASMKSSRSYESRDLAVAEELARRAALAIDNAQLYRDAQVLASDLAYANAVKDEFLGLVSHELNTPLTTIRGNAEVLVSRGEQLHPATRAAALDDIAAESQRLQRIIENLLFLARAEHAEILEREPVMVVRVAQEVVARHRQRDVLRSYTIVEQSAAWPVNLPEGYLEQVLENLLSNAEKYSPPNEPIAIEIEPLDDEVRVRVLDGGVGIRADEAERLFDPFYRSESSVGRTPGMGIGLAVCKRLVESQGGRIWARPRLPRGAEFGFSIPSVRDDESSAAD